MTPFVYFDLGGVVIRDFSKTNKWTKLKEELGIAPDRNQEFEKFWDKYEAKVCVGQDLETLLPLIKKKFGTKLPENYSFLIGGFVNRFEVNKSLWPLLKKLKESCRIGLLTNMYPHMLEAIKERRILPDIQWDAIVDSSVERVQKPDPAVYRLAESRAGVTGDKIYYVDNSLKNIEPAKRFGWKTFLYDSANYEGSTKQLETYFSQTGLF